MDLSTYAGLQTSIGDFLNRPDLVTGGQVAGFVQLAEATLKRRLRRKSGVSSLVFTAGANSMALPATVAELRSMAPAASVSWPRGAAPLTEVTFEMLTEYRTVLQPSGRPRYFAVLNGTVYVTPAPSADFLTFTISYIEALSPLSNTNTTNSVLAEAPDAYLYGACLQAAPFLEHDERVPMWFAAFEKAIEELNDKRQREEFGASLSKARLPMVFG